MLSTMSARPALDPARIVDAAMAVLDEHGLDGLTVRRIADRLAVRNPALYWHVASRQEIVDRLAERILLAAEAADEPGAPWQARLRGMARAFRRAMLAHRDGARVVASANLGTGPQVARVEGALAFLAEAGFTEHDSLLGVLAVFDYTLGATMEEQADPGRRDDTPSSRPDGRALAPRLAAAMAAMARPFDGDAVFEGGLGLLLDGLATRLR
jgi:TetR/AcrR family tetracycline transcriptional repressor